MREPKSAKRIFSSFRNPTSVIVGLVVWAVHACAAQGFAACARQEAANSVPPSSFALVGATVHTAVSDPIENGTVIVIDGKVVAAGAGLAIEEGIEQIDVSGKHVYPGMFESHTQLGLTEIDQVPVTVDSSEAGELNPNVKAIVAVNPDSELLPVTRSNGVLLALTAPRGGLVAGQSSVIQLDGWTWEDMRIREGASMQVAWPATALGGRRGPRGPRNRDDAGQDRYTGQVKILEDLIASTRAYQAGRSSRNDSQPLDLRLEAMIPVVEGKMPIMVRADTLKQIQDAVSFATRFQLKLIILGGFDAPRCIELLKANDVPVIISAVQRAPLRRHEDYESAYTVAARLREGGVRYCISATDRSETWNSRILPEQAGMAAAWGLDRNEALRAITLYPAQILGVSERVGSLENGKDATLFVADGDILEITSRVTRAWIQGKEIDLSNRQTRLYDRYRQKYEKPESDGTAPSGG
jgi:imidazolonepropionase-like amidohydrolase